MVLVFTVIVVVIIIVVFVIIIVVDDVIIGLTGLVIVFVVVEISVANGLLFKSVFNCFIISSLLIS